MRERANFAAASCAKNYGDSLILFFKYGRPYLDYTKTFYSDDLTSLIANINPRIFGLYISLYLAGAVMFRYIPTIVTIIFNTMMILKLYQHSKQLRSVPVPALDDCPN